MTYSVRTLVARLAAASRFGAVILGAVVLSAAPMAAQQTLTLKQAIALAQHQGFQAEAAQSTVDAARDRNRVFYAGYLPSLSLFGTTPNYNSSITSVIQPDGSTLYLPVQQTSEGLTAIVSQKVPWTNTTLSFSSGLNRVLVTGANGFTSWSSTPFSVGLSQPLFRSNSQRWDIKQQDIQMETTERKYLEAHEDAAIAATGAFFDLYAAGANLKNAIANVAVNDTLYTLNKGRLQIGSIGENDLLQSELALLRARQSLEDAKLANDRALAQFRITINVPPGTPVDITVTGDAPDFDVDTAAAVKWARANSSAMTDIAVTEVQADRAVSEARWNTGPGATINASYGYNATAGSEPEVYRNLLNAQALTVSVQVPLWQWGAHSGAVDAAKADRSTTRTNAEVNRAQIDLNAHFAALQLPEARRGLVIAAKADTVAEKRFGVAYNRYVIGKISVDNLYIAQTEKDAALVGYALALRAYWTAYYTLRRLTLYDFETGRPIRQSEVLGLGG